MCFWYEKDWVEEKHNDCAENLTKNWQKAWLWSNIHAFFNSKII